MVVVHIEHRDPRAALLAQSLRGHRRVVEKTVAAHEVRAGMVTRWAGGTEHGPFACGQATRGAQGGIRAGLGRRPGSGRQGRSVVHRIQTESRNEVVRLQVAAQRAHRPDRRKRLTRGVVRIQRHPVGPGPLQEGQVARAVNQRQHTAAVGLGRAQRMAARQQLRSNEICARGGFEARHTLATEELERGRMQHVPVGKVGDHAGKATGWALKADLRFRAGAGRSAAIDRPVSAGAPARLRTRRARPATIRPCRACG